MPKKASLVPDTPPTLTGLVAVRLKLHRLAPPRPLRGTRAATEFIKERGLVMATGHASLPVLTEAIAGRHLVGSWMVHPEAHRIYTILGRVAKSGVVSVPLILGKDTLLDPSLASAVERIATDAERCLGVRAQLSPLARRLLEAVEVDGRVRMDHWDVPTNRARPVRVLLERQLLVISSSFHTESGYHTSVVVPWSASGISKQFSQQAGRLRLAEAVDQLLLAGVRSAVIAPEAEVRRWLVFEGGRIDTLLAQGKLQRLTGPQRAYLTGGSPTDLAR